VNDQVSHPYKTTGKIIFLYILIFKCLDKWRKFTECWCGVTDTNCAVIINHYRM
jgi:hypothetical protein